MAYQQYPTWSGQKETGWFDVPGKGTRYHAGNGELRYTNAGTGDGPTKFELVPYLTQNAGRPMSAQAETRSAAQSAYNNGDRSQATLHALYPEKYGPPGSGSGKSKDEETKPEAPTAPVTEDPPKPDSDPAPTVESPASPTNRAVPAPNGGNATGTQTGPRGATMDEVNALLGRQGVGPLRNPFESNNLPGTEEYRPANTENQVGNQNIGPIKDGDQYMRNVEAARNGANTALSPDNASGDASLRFNPPEEMGEGAKYAPPTVNQSPKRSILDYDDVMTGLRAVEADRGYAVVGGKYMMANPNAEGGLQEISREGAYELKAGGDRAQNFLQGKMAELQADDQFSETMPPEVTVDGVNGIGPVNDGEKYANALAESENSPTKGIGPFKDGDRYASNFPNRRK